MDVPEGRTAVPDQITTEADKLAESIAQNFDGEVDSLLDLIRTSMKTMDAEIDNLRTSFMQEVRSLAETVVAARAEISSLKGEKEFGNPIPEATDELDAIVEHTAAATETILEACEHLDQFAASLTDEQSARVQEQTIRIYEACSFQDITGQRISKVVTALKIIENRIEAITGRYGMSNVARGVEESDSLLNGPQSADMAISQDEIDKLLTF